MQSQLSDWPVSNDVVILMSIAGLYISLRHQRQTSVAHDTTRGESDLQRLRKDAERRLHHQPFKNTRPEQLQQQRL